MTSQAPIFYASAGGANIIESHRWWRAGRNNPSEVSLTFSGQIESFADEQGRALYLVSNHPSGEVVDDKQFRIEHRPKRVARGWRYYLEELKYAWGLARSARKFGAKTAIVDSGAVEFFAMTLFKLSGLKIVIVLHNTIWPVGFRPRTLLKRMVEFADMIFFRKFCDGVIAVSPAAERQFREMAPHFKGVVFQTRAQFDNEYFSDIGDPPPFSAGPFHVMFIGRVVEAKGVLDIARMARSIDDRLPGAVNWTICGRGAALDRLRSLVDELDVGDIVNVRGWTSLEDLHHIYEVSHASIVPTRSGFAEGLAMTAVEAVLAGRPVITNPLVPAHELLEPACVLGHTNDVASHADAVLKLAFDERLYSDMRKACKGLAAPFLDRSNGLTAVLHRVFQKLDS